MIGLPANVSFPNERVIGRICPACSADRLLAFYAVSGLPTNADTLAATADEAEHSQTRDVVLALCETCAFVTDIAFESGSQGKASSLAHVADPLDLLTAARECEAESPVTVAVPDTRRMLDAGAFWQVSCQRPSYFTRESLTRVFQRSGFEVEHTSLDAGSRSILLGAVPTGGQKRDMPLPTELRSASQFVRVCRMRLLEWTAFADDARQNRRTCVVWGSGPVAVTFLGTLGIADLFECVVDADPSREGGFLRGTRLQVQAPAALRTLRPDLVIVTDSADRDAAEDALAVFGVSAVVRTLA